MSSVMMNSIFGKRKAPAGHVRENKILLGQSIREIQKEKQGLQTQEMKLISEIIKNANQGQIVAVKVMAKDLIRTRNQIEKLNKFKSQLQGVFLRIPTLKSAQAMGEAIKGISKAMWQMNRQMNLPSLQKTMQEFERQNKKMAMVFEVIDDAFEGDEEEEDIEDLVSQVLEEIGIDINLKLVNAPYGVVAVSVEKNKVVQDKATGAEDNGGIDYSYLLA